MSRLPSLRLHTKGYFFIRVAGKDHYLGKDKAEAKVQARLLLADYLREQPASPVRSPASELTIEEIAVEFLLEVKQRFERNTNDTGSYGRYKSAIQLLLDVHGKDKPSQFGPLALKRLRERLITQGLARATINTRIDIIRACFRWAVENELCPPSVSQALQAVMGIRAGHSTVKASKKVRPVPLDIVEKTLPHLPSVVADLVQFQMHSGMRSSEMLQLRACDIDMSRDVWRYSPKVHKGAWRGKERVIFFGPHCQEILRPYLESVGDDTERYLFSPKDSLAKHKAKRRAERRTKVQPSQQNRAKENPKKSPGDKYRRDSYRNAILRACKRANIPHWFPHQIRKSRSHSV
ncbi:MAG: tyrosine-type recombinase/integrase [Thermoguttaceae bacterium]